MTTNYETILDQGVMSYSLDVLRKHSGKRYNALVKTAFFFSAGAHSEQVRKFSGLPYVIHPVHVACIVAKYVPSASPELLAACILHDTIEDTPVDYETVAELFGTEVADLVDEVTKRDFLYDDATKPELKEFERIRLATVSPQAQTLKCGDMLSNTRSMRTENPDRFATYVLENRRLFDTITDADPVLRERVERMFSEMGVS